MKLQTSDMKKLRSDLSIMVNNLEILRDLLEGESALVSFYDDTLKYLDLVIKVKAAVSQELRSRQLGG